MATHLDTGFDALLADLLVALGGTGSHLTRSRAQLLAEIRNTYGGSVSHLTTGQGALLAGIVTAAGGSGSNLTQSPDQMLQALSAALGGSASALSQSPAEMLASIVVDAGEGEDYAASAVTFDGNMGLMRSGSLGVGNYTQLLISGWFKMAAADSTILKSHTNGFLNLSVSSTEVHLDAYDSGFNGDSVYGDIAPGAWMHLLGAYDGSDDAKCKWLVNGVDETSTVSTFNSGPATLTGEAAFTLFQHILGAGGAFVGDVADIYIAFGQWLDLTNPANVAKFIAAGKPVDLGADGSTPTGTAPTIFFSGDASEFATNKGLGGAFVLANRQETQVFIAEPGAVGLSYAPLSATVLGVIDTSDDSDISASFESTISVENEIQQTAGDFFLTNIRVTLSATLTDASTSPSD